MNARQNFVLAIDTISDAAGGAEIETYLQKPAEALTIQDIATAFHNPAFASWKALQSTTGDAAEFLGAALAASANLLDPQIIVIAGSIQLMGAAYLELVRQSFLRRALAPRRAVQIIFSTLGADPTLIGAALLARQRFFGKSPQNILS